jgi:hypothetical protein
MWWLWILGGLFAWTVVALFLAVLVGRGIRLADMRSPATGVDGVLTTADLPASLRAPAAPARRRVIPLPPIGIALLSVAVTLETIGYVARLTGWSGPASRLLSMDAPLSVPRMFLATMFAAAALAAVAGAGSLTGRRTWWMAVGAVAGGIAAVKAGSTVHADALRRLADAVGGAAALVISAAVAASVVGVLWFLSREEQRDRRRVLGALAFYAVASVGLSAISSLIGGAYGGASTAAATATFLEESGEAIAGVAFLIAVLAGVAPRLVLPATWALRRTADAHTLVLPERLPGRLSKERPARP